MALGTLVVAPLAVAEAADARPVDDSGAPVPTTGTPDRTPLVRDKPVAAPPRDPKPANPTIDTDAPPPVRRSYGDEHRQPVPAPVRERPEPKPRPANPTIDTDAPPPVRRSHGDEHRQLAPVRERVKPDPKPRPEPKLRPANPTIDTDATPPVRRSYGDEHRQPTPVPAPPAPANPTIDTDATPPVRRSYGDEHRHPVPVRERPKPANPTIDVGPDRTPTIGTQPRTPVEVSPRVYADDRRQPMPVRQPEPAEPNPFAGVKATGSAPISESDEDDDDDGGFSLGIDVNLPGDRFDFGGSVKVKPPAMPDIDPEWLTNPRGKWAEESEDAGENVAEGITAGAERTRQWMDSKPMCAGGTVYRYGGGGGELCVDTSTGETSWKGQLGVGSGGTVKFHRPDELPVNFYCGGGVTVSSPVMYGSYERRYDFTTNSWYNEYEYGASVPYKNKKYLPLDGASTRRTNGRHVAGRGERRPPANAAPRHRAAPSPAKTVKSYTKPGSAAAYGVCGGPGPDLY